MNLLLRVQKAQFCLHSLDVKQMWGEKKWCCPNKVDSRSKSANKSSCQGDGEMPDWERNRIFDINRIRSMPSLVNYNMHPPINAFSSKLQHAPSFLRYILVHTVLYISVSHQNPSKRTTGSKIACTDKNIPWLTLILWEVHWNPIQCFPQNNKYWIWSLSWPLSC